MPIIKKVKKIDPKQVGFNRLHAGHLYDTDGRAISAFHRSCLSRSLVGIRAVLR